MIDEVCEFEYLVVIYSFRYEVAHVDGLQGINLWNAGRQAVQSCA